MSSGKALRVLGKRTIRKDGIAKVTSYEKYASDISFPNMLHAARAHESKRYDYGKAEKLIEKEFGDKLRHGEHIIILSKDSSRYFGKSIEKIKLWFSRFR